MPCKCTLFSRKCLHFCSKKTERAPKNVVRVPFFGRFDAKSVLKLAQFGFQRFDFSAKNFVGSHLFF